MDDSCGTPPMRFILGLTGILAALLVVAVAASAKSSPPDDGISAAPGSPAAKQYQIPLDAGRSAGGAGHSGSSGSSGSQGSSASSGSGAGPRFGVGITAAAAATTGHTSAGH